ncbi:hypothetical protein BH24ACI1_BH24ACI1_05430 [soil metagenome]
MITVSPESRLLEKKTLLRFVFKVNVKSPMPVRLNWASIGQYFYKLKSIYQNDRITVPAVKFESDSQIK